MAAFVVTFFPRWFGLSMVKLTLYSLKLNMESFNVKQVDQVRDILPALPHLLGFGSMKIKLPS